MVSLSTARGCLEETCLTLLDQQHCTLEEINHPCKSLTSTTGSSEYCLRISSTSGFPIAPRASPAGEMCQELLRCLCEEGPVMFCDKASLGSEVGTQT